MNIYHEHMIRFVRRNWTIRVWMNADRSGIMLPDNVLVAHHTDDWLAKHPNPNPSRLDLANGILSLDGCNAVEVLDSDGNGEVLYKDWP